MYSAPADKTISGIVINDKFIDGVDEPQYIRKSETDNQSDKTEATA